TRCLSALRCDGPSVPMRPREYVGREFHALNVNAGLGWIAIEECKRGRTGTKGALPIDFFRRNAHKAFLVHLRERPNRRCDKRKHGNRYNAQIVLHGHFPLAFLCYSRPGQMRRQSILTPVNLTTSAHLFASIVTRSAKSFADAGSV